MPNERNRFAGIGIGILTFAVVLSLVISRPATVGERLLAALDRAHSRTRAALLLFDYRPDARAVAAAAREIIERGSGAPDGYSLGTSAAVEDRRWIKTTDALFSWTPASVPTALRQSIRDAAPVLSLAVAHTPLDEAATDVALRRAAAALDARTDEALFLDWVHADRGVLAEATDRAVAVREALLLLGPSNAGPVLAFTVADHHVYLLPDAAGEGKGGSEGGFIWCELQAFDAAGHLAWAGVLRLNGLPAPERMRTLAVMMAEEVLAPAPRVKTAPVIPLF